MGDNRAYQYASDSRVARKEYVTIQNWIPEGCRVLDLGCGDGSLLQALIQTRNIQAEGMEISDSGVEVCRSRGLEVQQGRIDQPLPWGNDAFDFAVCNVTLQMVMCPEKLLAEMARVAPRQIVSFPNFANLKNRLEMLFLGRMPRAMLFGHTWWNTGHIHQLSLNDLQDLLPQLGLAIRRKAFLGRMPLKSLAPNLLATLGIFELGRS